MNTPGLLKFVYALSQQPKRVATDLQPMFLLVIRLYWGWQFFQTGLRKPMDIPKATAFFESLGIVVPAFNGERQTLCEGKNSCKGKGGCKSFGFSSESAVG